MVLGSLTGVTLMLKISLIQTLANLVAGLFGRPEVQNWN
jgi:hypothetical protein